MSEQIKVIKVKPVIVDNPETQADTDLGCGLSELIITGKDDPYYKPCVGHDWRADDRLHKTVVGDESIDTSNTELFHAMSTTEEEKNRIYDAEKRVANATLDATQPLPLAIAGKIANEVITLGRKGSLFGRRQLYTGLVNVFTWLRLVK